MIFCFFWKVTAQKKKRKCSSPTPPLSGVQRASVNSCWHLDLSLHAFSVSGQSSKAHYLHSALEMWHPWVARRKTVPRLSHTAWAASRIERGGWWSSGGIEEGLEVVAAEPACVLWPSNSSICTPLSFPLPLNCCCRLLDVHSADPNRDS